MSPERDPFRLRVIRPFGVFREDPPFHLRLLQAVAFAYFLYRILSRNYAVYGLLDEDAFDYRTAQTTGMELWPVPLLHWVSLQVLYDFVPHPSAGVIRALQYVAAGACALGLAGVAPRLSAAVAFALGLHLKGMMQHSNSMTDGGTLALVALLIVALAPRQSVYRLGGPAAPRRDAGHHWPVFVLFLMVGAFYATAGLNKVVQDGPLWPFNLHLEGLAGLGVERSLFRASRFTSAPVAAALGTAGLSVAAGLVTLAGELGFGLILFVPRLRLFCVASMIAFHHLVFAFTGINFVGSSLLLLLCLDWNAPLRAIDVAVDPRGGRLAGMAARLARGRRIRRVEAGALGPEAETALPARRILVRDEDGACFGGLEALDQVLLRRWWGLPGAALLRVPGLLWALDRLLLGRGSPPAARRSSML